MLGTISHELVHKWDYREVAFNDTICIFYLPDSFNSRAGSYDYSVLEADIPKADEIQKTTEYKAYAIDFFILSVFICVFTWDYFERREQNDDNKILRKMLREGGNDGIQTKD